MVPGEGVEPSHPYGRQILSLLRLPFRHPGSDGTRGWANPMVLHKVGQIMTETREKIKREMRECSLHHNILPTLAVYLSRRGKPRVLDLNNKITYLGNTKRI